MLIRVAWAALAVCGLAGAAGPSCGAVAGWSQQGDARTFGADNLFEYMDGNAEGYLIYGFQSMHGVTCKKGGVTLVIDLSDFGDVDSSYGMFSANRDPRQPTAGAKLGMGLQIVPRRGLLVKGKYYLEIAADPEGDYTSLLREWLGALEKTIEGSTEPPAALSWFPAAQLQSLRLVPESVLGIRILKRGYAAQYEFGKAFVVNDEAAPAAMEKLRARFGETSAAPLADEAFQVNDKYLGRLCFFRKGKYIGGYANVAEGQDPLALAKALAARLP
jgi:hypothetical protein